MFIYANAMGLYSVGPTIKSSKSEEANKSVPPKRLVKMDKFMWGGLGHQGEAKGLRAAAIYSIHTA